ncbi:hypothetical protein MFIFM68171_07406 [Madurella fahalii]|uniref:Heterokaryon incompatibility domain-containing protein n=1 Tax=Madurella fahalii TaxID=1157608 RepID=A0ABQ0GHG4_9PEZI
MPVFRRAINPNRTFLPRLRRPPFLESTPPILPIICLLIIYPLLVGLVFFSSGLAQNQHIGAAVGVILSSLAVIGATVGILFLYGLYHVIRWVAGNVDTFVHLVSGGRLVIRTPRFRNADLFWASQLCERCMEVVRGSSLLRGTWWLVTRASERHRLYGGLEDMEGQIGNGCSLCEALMSQRIGDEEETGRAVIVGDGARGYGTMVDHGPGNVEADGVKLRVQFVKGSVWPKGPANLAMFLEARGMTRFKGLLVSEGPLVAERDPHGHTGSGATFNTIASWIKDCEHHSACCLPASPPLFLPTRLVFVGTLSSPSLRLVNTHSDLSPLTRSTTPRYIALSHCWGGNIPDALTARTLPLMRESIAEPTLPRNFRDAIHATRRLGVQYLWIDSLCILQDSAVDWATESPTMGQVYAHAHCVIAATASADAQGGCFRERSPTWRERTIMASAARRCFVSSPPLIRDLFYWRVELAPLTGRAWAFQERLLARRVVHFCEGVVLFECNTLQASELHVHGARYATEPYVVRDGKLVRWLDGAVLGPLRNRMSGRGAGGVDAERAAERAAVRGIRGALDVLQSLGPVSRQSFGEKIEFYKRWYEMVSAYSQGQLTRQSDRLVALAGVAELVQKRAQVPYLAGLWASGIMELGLLWVVKGPREKQFPCCAPSWSWASANGRIGLLPRGSLGSRSVSVRSVILEATIDEAEALYQGRSVSEARSPVDEGRFVVTGPAAIGRLSSDRATLAVAGSDGDDSISLRFFPDWELGQQSEVGSWELIVLHLVTVYRSESEVHSYGLVLRKKEGDGQDVFERVGAWTASDEFPHNRAIHSQIWTRRRVVLM